MTTPTAKTIDEIAQAYDSEPWWYDLRGFFILTFAYRSTLGTQLRLFGENFGPRHLEVAVGSGTLLKLVLLWRKWRSMPASQIEAIDYAPSMLAGARRRFAKRPDINLLLADVALLPYENDSFDTVNVANAVHCLPRLDESLRQIARVVKPGGRVAMNVLLYPTGPAPLRWIANKINAWGMRKGILYTPYQALDISVRLSNVGLIIAECSNFSGNTWNIVAKKPQ